MRLIAVSFDHEVDAVAARDELRVRGLPDANVHRPRLEEVANPLAGPVLIARIPAAQIPSVRRVLLRHHGRIVIDLDERDTRP